MEGDNDISSILNIASRVEYWINVNLFIKLMTNYTATRLLFLSQSTLASSSSETAVVTIGYSGQAKLSGDNREERYFYFVAMLMLKLEVNTFLESSVDSDMGLHHVLRLHLKRFLKR